MIPAVSPVFRIVAENVHRIPIGTLIDAGPHRNQGIAPGYLETIGFPVPDYECAFGLPLSVVEPVNQAARDLVAIVTP